MKNIFVLFIVYVFLSGLVGLAAANESMAVNTPIPADPLGRASATSVTIERLVLDYKNSLIDIMVWNGSVEGHFQYTGTTALSLMNALNKANLSTTSLNKRVMQQLNSDGYMTGTITGTPD